MANKKVMILHIASINSNQSKGVVSTTSLYDYLRHQLFIDLTLDYVIIGNIALTTKDPITFIPITLTEDTIKKEDPSLTFFANKVKELNPDLVVIGVDTNKDYYHVEEFKAKSELPTDKTFILNQHTFNKAVICPKLLALVKS